MNLVRRLFKTRLMWRLGVIVTGMVLVGVFVSLRIAHQELPGTSPSAGADIAALPVAPYLIPDDALLYPTNVLFVTQERQDYRSGDMMLEISSLGLNIPVVSGTGDSELMEGVGLYEMSQLPGTINDNVSIAGHRDLGRMEFYDIDKLGAGDLICLTHEGKRYVYEYLETYVVEEDDWSPIYSREYACVTLTSCHPIGVASHRMVVVGVLTQVEQLDYPV